MDDWFVQNYRERRTILDLSSDEETVNRFKFQYANLLSLWTSSEEPEQKARTENGIFTCLPRFIYNHISGMCWIKNETVL